MDKKTLLKYAWRIRLCIAALMLLGFAFVFYGLLPQALAQLQVGPALLRTIATFSLVSLAILMLFVLFTLLFGRFYCSMCCPLGILQDIDWHTRSPKWTPKAKAIRHPLAKVFRYGITGLVLGALISGTAVGFLLFDPYSNAGRIAHCSTLVGILLLLALIVVRIWRKRVFCQMVCPVGTLLGLLSKWSFFGLRISEDCLKCTKCAQACPMGCIDLEHRTIDSEACIRCMRCVSECPKQAISIVKCPPRAVDTSRRNFLLSTGALLAGIGVGAALVKVGKAHLTQWMRRLKILPPGAVNTERFASKCTGCQLCVAACPAGIIVPADASLTGAGTVTVDLSRGACAYDCTRCSEVCPTGAILPLTLLEKQKTKIAEAALNAKHCKVFQQDEACGLCAEACPTGAIRLRKTGAPYRLKAALCIGCGACQVVCPGANGAKAITLHEVEQQTTIGE